MADNISVLISGAGLAGLMLANCLERAGIAYLILEKQKEIKPLGSALTLGPNVANLLQQLGMLEEVWKVSKPLLWADIMMENGKPVGRMLMDNHQVRYGATTPVLARNDLYNILLKRIPVNKIQLGRRVLSVSRTDEGGVCVSCHDGSTHRADILVGADGAYSAVRQRLFQAAKSRKVLPPSDDLPLRLTFSCLVGTTSMELDTTQYPQLLEERAHMDVMVSMQRSVVCALFTVPGNKICWMVGRDIKSTTEDNELFRNSQWSSEATQEMIAEFYDQPTPFGGKLGDLMDKTDPELISKVLLEEKMFDTWFDERTVLIGDACHKMTPHAGQGAVQAFMDAASLANCLNDLTDTTQDSITKAFERYKSERYDIAKQAVVASESAGALYGKTFKDAVIRFILLKLAPEWLLNLVNDKMRALKAQLTFLPFVDDEGLIKNKIVYTPSKRMAKEYETAGFAQVVEHATNAATVV